MDIQHKENNNSGKFFIEQGEEEIAVLTYNKNEPNRMTINHTGVIKDLEGQGLGTKMVEKAVIFARENNLQLVPQCPFARAVINRNEDWQDVL